LTLAQYSSGQGRPLQQRPLGMVQLEQEAAGLPHFGCELKNPNFAALAEAIGLTGLRVEDPARCAPPWNRRWRQRAPCWWMS